jgi:hypothetical protein
MNRALARCFLASLVAAISGCSACRDDGGGDSVEGGAASSSSAPANAASGFTPKKDGFGFPNYGDEVRVQNLTAREVRALFGDRACAAIQGDRCILTPQVARWMDESNRAMANGHCEGFAVLSLLLQQKKVALADFGGAPSAFGLKLSGNARLQSAIARWFVTQTIEPVASARVGGAPSAIVATLADAFQTGKEAYSMGFFQRDGQDGHAVTPYAVVDKGSGLSWIMIYDNNFPGEERHLEVDRGKETWTYFTASNPKEPGENYDGDADSQTLFITPLSKRLGELVCDVCGDVAEDDTPRGAALGKRQVWLDGDADLLITDDGGKRLGQAGGKLVSEIPGASALPILTGGSNHEPVYFVPSGKHVTVTIDGSTLKKAEPSDVALIGPGYTLGVLGVDLKPNQKDHIDLSASGRDIRYTTETDETPALMIGIETPGPDYLVFVKVVGEARGQTIDLSVDPKKGRIGLEIHGKSKKSAYAVELHRLDDGGDQVFTHEGLAIGSSDLLLFDYAHWKGDHHPVALSIDKNHDGTIDKVEQLKDDDTK